MTTQIGFIQDLEEIITTDATCRKCGGLGYIKTFTRLPNGGICYRCDGLGVSNKDKKQKVVKSVTTKPLNVTFLKEGQTFEEMLADRELSDSKIQEQIKKFEETGDLLDLFS